MKNKILFALILIISIVIVASCDSNTNKLGFNADDYRSIDVNAVSAEKEFILEHGFQETEIKEISGRLISSAPDGTFSIAYYSQSDIYVMTGDNRLYSIEDCISIHEKLLDFLIVNENYIFFIATDKDDYESPLKCIVFNGTENTILKNQVLDFLAEPYSDAYSFENMLYIVAGSEILELNIDLEVINSKTLPEYYFSSIVCDDQYIYAACNQDDVVVLRKDTFNTIKKHTFDSTYNIRSLSFLGYSETPIVLLNEDTICSYDYEEQEISKIANLSELRISTLNGDICCGDTISFIGSYRDVDGIYVITIGDPIEGVTDLTVAMIDYDRKPNDYWIENKIADYNSSNTEYHISIIEYSSDDIVALTSSLLSDPPDLICCNSDMVYSLVNSNILLDMQENISFNDDDFIDSIWNASLTEDGKRYWVTPFVSVVGFAGYDSEFFSCKKENVIRHNTRENLSIQLLPLLCNPDEYDFVKLSNYLSFIGETSVEDYTEKECVVSQLERGTLGYLDADIGGFGNYLLLCEYFGASPVMCNQMFTADIYLSIAGNSDCISGCEDFLNYVLSDDSLADDRNNTLSRMPISKTVLETEIEIMSDAYLSGNITPNKAVIDNVYQYAMLVYRSDWEEEQQYLSITEYQYNTQNNMNPEELMIAPKGLTTFTQSDINYLKQQYLDLLDSTDRYFIIDNDMLKIINEEIGPFYSGEKDSKTVAAIIDGRINSYLSEQGY